ncbi:hypothetical protein B0J11DRAFT_613585 [Dendryphion nanum]|uniref:Suppressor of anucleate metulae protein B n=1 Tax=Dendryphion nanum TaxID=256645 RepID=A0A9P9IPL9_9PLEO|nr:hypothetical protein B0J11DRAFT_613585 [Dendryphion nanum]
MNVKTCIKCTKAATTSCDKCKGYLNSDGVNFYHECVYCSEECKEADRSDHQPRCRKTLDHRTYTNAQRAGEVARALFYQFVPWTWTHDIRHVQTRRDPEKNLFEVIVYEGTGVEEGPCHDGTLQTHSGGWFFQFPVIIQDVRLDITAALVTDRNSTWAFVIMPVIVRLLFLKLSDAKCIFEVTYNLRPDIERLAIYMTNDGKKMKERTDQPYPDDRGTHSVYVITLKSGTTIALDLAYAQFRGPRECVQPWNDYQAKYVSTIIKWNPLGTALRAHNQLLARSSDISRLSVITNIQLSWQNMITTRIPVEIGIDLAYLPVIESPIEYILHRNKISTQALLYMPLISDAFDKAKPVAPGFPNGMKHPKYKKLPDSKTNRNQGILFPTYSIEFNLPKGSRDVFDWNRVKIVVEDDSASDDRRAEAKRLLRKQYIVRLHGSEKCVAFDTSLPNLTLPPEWISENPYWIAPVNRMGLA